MSKLKKQLLVEGNDDLHVMRALCQKFDVKENFEIIDCKGIENLLVQIPLRLKQSGIETLAIIIDADLEINNRWKSLISIFLNIGIILPTDIPIEGLILKSKEFVIAVWIMPNNNLNGMIEDFISFLIPKEDELFPIAIQTLDDIEMKKINKYIPAHKSKALIHSWLSWQEDPGTPMGLAITKKILTTEEETCLRLTSWLTNAFQ